MSPVSRTHHVTLCLVDHVSSSTSAPHPGTLSACPARARSRSSAPPASPRHHVTMLSAAFAVTPACSRFPGLERPPGLPSELGGDRRSLCGRVFVILFVFLFFFLISAVKHTSWKRPPEVQPMCAKPSALSPATSPSSQEAATGNACVFFSDRCRRTNVYLFPRSSFYPIGNLYAAL